jgi:nucleotidyltransferase/DNA polymerase involved in DNA repair
MQLTKQCPIRRMGLDELFIDVTSHVTATAPPPGWTGAVLTATALLDEAEANLHAPVSAGEPDTGLLRAGAAAASLMRQRMRARLGFTCSVGVAHGPTYAKLAGARRKPDNQTTMIPSGYWALIGDLPLKKVPGCGRASCARFAEVACMSRYHTPTCII